MLTIFQTGPTGHSSCNFLFNATRLVLHFLRSWHFLSTGKVQDFNKALVAVGSFTNLRSMRFSDFTKSILISLKLDTLQQISSGTSALKITFITLWNISTRDASKKGTLGLSVWKASKKPLSWLAISMKNCNFTGMDLSVKHLTKFLIGFVVWPFTLTLTFPVLDALDYVWP